MAIKLPFKIRSPNVTHGDHDFFVWSSLFLLYRLIIRCHYNNTSSVLTWSIVIYSMDVGDLILNETIQI